MTQIKPITGKFIVLVTHDGEWTVAGSYDHTSDPCRIIADWALAECLDSADYDIHILDIEIPIVKSPRFGKPKCRVVKES